MQMFLYKTMDYSEETLKNMGYWRKKTKKTPYVLGRSEREAPLCLFYNNKL